MISLWDTWFTTLGLRYDRLDAFGNELTYRIGLLELRLLAQVRDINGRWNSQAFFSVRRYYGT